MRIAFCFNGLSSGHNDKGHQVNSWKAFENMQKHIFSKNDVDVFCHTWGERNQALLDALKPIDAAFEEPKVFDGIDVGSRLHSIYSRWHSHKKVTELKRKHEIENDVRYDFVMVCRFDVLFFRDLVFSEYDPDNFHIAHWCEFTRGRKKIGNKNVYTYLEKEKIELRDLTHIHKGYEIGEQGVSDFWFFSSSENMDKFASVFDNIEGYGEESNHRLAVKHLETIGLDSKVKFTLHRYFDFALVRRALERCLS
jgi:hypothetical protein